MKPDQDQQQEGKAGRFRWVIVVLILVVAGAGVLAVRAPTKSAPAGSPATDARGCGSATDPLGVGVHIPADCMVERVGSGAVASLAQLQDAKPMVLNFWATWCAACVKEMPDFQQVYAAAGGRVTFVGLDLLGVQGEYRLAAVEFARQRSVTYPLAYDANGSLYQRLSTRVLLPTTILIRADGTIAYRQFGQLSGADLRKLIQQYFGVEVPA